ncbi:MAG TPA: imidazole glycerol phosphate synthase subunit HisH [Candidatus Thermoplasmatota archaeon]|nr:imidazole glycerol phosphate synthase subunit HisH [Candidatus Thermoplasmatota archaeon]
MIDVTLFDYGVGNIHSLTKALEKAGGRPRVTTRADELASARVLVLPGVGAFGEGARGLAPVREKVLAALQDGVPCLGICLGLQLLFRTSEESPGAEGIGFVDGEVKRLRGPKLPQIGWNVLAFRDDEPLFRGLVEGTHVYYVNSYAPVPHEPVTVATTTYGHTFTAAVRKKHTYGVQFHPEKSSKAGLTMLRNFLEFAESVR